MANLFVLTYTFLRKEATVLVHKKVRPTGVTYTITLLQEPLHQFFIDRIVVNGDPPFPCDDEERHSVIHAIRKALHFEIEAGLL